MHFPVVPEALGGSAQGKPDSLAAGEQNGRGKGKHFPSQRSKGSLVLQLGQWAQRGQALGCDANSLRLGTVSHRLWLVLPSSVCPSERC